MKSKILLSWKSPNILTYLLYPLSAIYLIIIFIRKKLYQTGLLSSFESRLPVIVVGNLSVGGTGKTPLVIYLYELLQSNGYTPGIISRGYRGNPPCSPYLLDSDSQLSEVGDEMYMVYQKTKAPIVVGAKRGLSVALLERSCNVDVIISDDGLQHYALQRDIEICVIDKTSQQKNKALLPAGPMREPDSRLQQVDFIIRHISSDDKINNGVSNPKKESYAMRMQAQTSLIAVNKATEQSGVIPSKQNKVNAVAGIGNPERFFNTCRELGWNINPIVFPDHHSYFPSDFVGNSAVIMTEKDAVKCTQFTHSQLWYFTVEANLEASFALNLLDTLKCIADKKNNQKSH